MSATFRTLLPGYPTSLTLALTKISGDDPAGPYALTHDAGEYSASIDLVGRYQCRLMDDSDIAAAGYVDLVDGQVCEPVGTIAELELIDRIPGVIRTAVQDADAETAQTTTITNAISGIEGAIGSGSVEKELTFKVGTAPADGVAVWVTTDQEGENTIAGTLHTNGQGKVKFMLDPTGAGEYYYAWCQKNGINFPNPTPFTVVAP